jgi:hypothetical protein
MPNHLVDHQCKIQSMLLLPSFTNTRVLLNSVVDDAAMRRYASCYKPALFIQEGRAGRTRTRTPAAVEVGFSGRPHGRVVEGFERQEDMAAGYTSSCLSVCLSGIGGGYGWLKWMVEVDVVVSECGRWCVVSYAWEGRCSLFVRCVRSWVSVPCKTSERLPIGGWEAAPGVTRSTPCPGIPVGGLPCGERVDSPSGSSTAVD